jgi:hypothetical protein
VSSTDDPCPGVGRCHNASWCASCEVTQYGPCDVRARGDRCDSHPSAACLEPLLAQAEHEALCADQDAGRAEYEACKAEAVAAKLRDTAKARWATLAARQEEVDDLRRALDAARADESKVRPLTQPMPIPRIELARQLTLSRLSVLDAAL